MSAVNELMQAHVADIVEDLRWYFGLGPEWQVRIVAAECVEATGEPFRASCECDPEYKEATIRIDFNNLHTGDQVEEIVAHELVHIPLMWLHNQADNLAGLAANLHELDHQVNAQGEYNREQVRRAAEKSATDIGHVVLRMYRRIQELERRLGIEK
jgi:hypothetical protein